MNKVLCFVGKKTSGKNTLCNFLHGYQLRSMDIISDFELLDTGELIIKAKDEKDNEVFTKIDINSSNLEYAEWAAYNVWPFVKQYAFADSLKQIVSYLFEIPREHLYGTDEQKKTVAPHLRWENMPGVVTEETPEVKSKVTGRLGKYYEKIVSNNLIYHSPGPMTAREVLQFFGTEVVRKMYEPAWINKTINNIKNDGSVLSIITDGRFSDELQAVHDIGGKTIYLTKGSSDDAHSSENGCSPEECTAVLNNKDQTVLESCQELVGVLEEWGWMDSK